ncbi:MAG TPA: 5-oxoprolinase subunit PxpA [Acidimicrobiales bacterium]|nr:5-oxoprolinase subunit PxpA [Acidimicrobiales bacterium]
MSIDLNADVGEEASGPRGDAPILGVVTSASIACGFHAGDAQVMHRTLVEAASAGVTVGAHPSYADRAGFGRAEQDVEPDRIADDVLYQVGALDGLARACGAHVRYVKPHGALYNRMAVDVRCAKAVGEAVRAYGSLVLLAPAGTLAVSVAKRLGVDVATEVFADRAYLPDGRLVPRGSPGAVVTDPSEAAARAVSLARDHRVASVEGGFVALEGSSICVHSDTPGSLEIARSVRRALEEAGFDIAPFVS